MVSGNLPKKNPEAEGQHVDGEFAVYDNSLSSFGLDFEFKDRQSFDELMPLTLTGGTTNKGGSAYAALPKKVTADLDEDDQRLVDLKRLGYSDQVVADTLAEEGRIRYDRKTISSRYSRILAAIRAQKDHFLEEEIHEWGFEDDEKLIIAYNAALNRVHDEVQAVKERKFQFVAQEMAVLNPDSAFSARACRDRFISIMNGTAQIPTCLDDNPSQRMQDRDTRIEARNRERISQEAAIAAERAEDQRRLNAIKVAKANAREEAAAKKAKLLAEKAKAAADRAAAKMAEAAAAHRVSAARAEMAYLLRTGPDNASGPIKNASTPLKRILSSQITPSSEHTDSSISAVGKIEDPRSHLRTSQLKLLCQQRKLPTSENRHNLLRNLDSSAERMKVTELKALLRSSGLPVTGSREVLKYRLAQADRDSMSETECRVDPVSLDNAEEPVDHETITNMLMEGMCRSKKAS